MTRTFLIIPRVRVINANAMSAPFIIGLPSITSFMGFTHKLQLDIHEEINRDIRFLRTGISIHSFNLRAYKEGSRNLLSITRNPLKKDGTSPSFVEEAKCNFEVSIVIEVSGINCEENITDIISYLNSSLMKYKISSGDLLSFSNPLSDSINVENISEVKGFLKKLMIGYVLTERKDLIKNRINEEKCTNSLDAMLDFLKINIKDENGNKEFFKIESGWFVPISVGYHGITPLISNKEGSSLDNNQRDPRFKHVFCESLITLGEFKLPTTLNNIDDFLWKYAYESEKNYFYCTTHN
ncbi:CRISPR associated Cys2 family protein [Taylorella asinigenitalis 14/45]|uniref:CRISPR associated Cys2 family protein n=1 Tax=Taylorella asinigenitalis 14/45 TaxID=1091495 RepID=I7IKW4_9BURK|nr:type I-F CRISPR-associated protein Csy2 [Taylorella asinigenitalis]CCG19559.1 CRISPR associated Cys2 family protein [Taylorella asinigenitalis 14/45]